MTDAPSPQQADVSTIEAPPDAPRVRVLLSVVEGADLDAALATIRRQVYEPTPEVVVIGPAAELPDAVIASDSLERAIAGTDSEFDYLWFLHSDARPRPDALRALVSEVERAEAALGGSKLLVAGSPDVLESVGSATDVFGEPYTGLDEGEIDLQQYDVVREVAFVGSASMLVRRDLAQGLKGLDDLLPPVAAGLDFSQRARLAGGRVVSVPSSEVYHQGRCEQQFRGWREQAGRLRAMATVYSPLTLLWLLPYDFLVSIADSLASLLLLRWKPAVQHGLSWLWNLIHLPSLIAARRRFRRVRALGDEELFRFQARGSVRLRELGAEASGRVLSVFDEDQALARGSRRVWSSPGIWGAVIAVLVVAFSVRGIVFGGVPNVGASFPFEPPTVALDRWFAGWNDSGLGSSDPVHPAVGITGLISFLWFGAEGAARTLLTIAFGVLGVVGLGRLSGRLGYRGPGRYLSGLVLLAGPGTSVIVGAGSWMALGAAAFLPWAVRASFVHPDEIGRGRVTHVAWALLLGVPLAALSPLLAAVPLLTVLAWKIMGGSGSSLWLSILVLVGGAAAVPFLMGDPGWVFDESRRLGLTISELWPVLIAIAFAPLVLVDRDTRRLGLMGAVLAAGALILVRLPYGGPGYEEAVLVLVSFGTALLVAAGLDRISADLTRLMPAVAAAAILVLSLGPMTNGHLGLPSGDVNDRLAFGEALADEESGPGRILIASIDRSDLPGEARQGPGFWYRLLDARGTTLDEVWLSEPRSGDVELDAAIAGISSGSELRPGSRLAEFSIDWVVLVGPSFRLDDVLIAQLDLVPTPLDQESRVFENPASHPIAGSSVSSWLREGAGFMGEPAQARVAITVNHSDRWEPDPVPEDWHVAVSAETGSASYRGDETAQALALAGAVVLGLALLLAVWGRARR